MDWYEAAWEYDKRTTEHENRLLSLLTEWQRELVALRRLQSNVFNGGYLQFFANCGRETYVYATQALKKIGAHVLAAIIDHCQALIDEHFPAEEAASGDLTQLLPNRIINREGETTKEPGSVLPDSVLVRISELSYEYMELPDDLGTLAENYFRAYLGNG